MRRRRLLILFLVFLFTLLQCTALDYIKIFKVKPDILLILLFFISLYYGHIYGLSVGALCGFFSEATSGLPLGICVFTYSLAGLISGYTGRLVYPTPQKPTSRVYNQRIFSEVSLSFIFSFSIYLLLSFLFQIHNIALPLLNTLTSIILPVSVYTACVTPVLFCLFKIIFNTRKSLRDNL